MNRLSELKDRRNQLEYAFKLTRSHLRQWLIAAKIVQTDRAIVEAEAREDRALMRLLADIAKCGKQALLLAVLAGTMALTGCHTINGIGQDLQDITQPYCERAERCGLHSGPDQLQ